MTSRRGRRLGSTSLRFSGNFRSLSTPPLARRACPRYNPAMTQTESLAPNPRVEIGGITFANDAPIALFAGPCQMESRAHALEMASALKEMAAKLGIGLVYKTSFDKANRTS